MVMRAAQPHRCHARRTPLRLWAVAVLVGRRSWAYGGWRRGRCWGWCRRRGRSPEGAGDAVDQRVGVGQVIGVIAPEATCRPRQHGGPDVLGAWQEIVVANLVHAGRLRVPLVGRGG